MEEITELVAMIRHLSNSPDRMVGSFISLFRSNKCYCKYTPVAIQSLLQTKHVALFKHRPKFSMARSLLQMLACDGRCSIISRTFQGRIVTTTITCS